MAHAVHPNYATKYEDKHKPKLNHGVVLKVQTFVEGTNFRSMQMHAMRQIRLEWFCWTRLRDGPRGLNYNGLWCEMILPAEVPLDLCFLRNLA